jgi:hypothetical protein
MAIVLDTGALIAIDRGDRSVFALLDAAKRRQLPVLTSSGCVAQAWRVGGLRQARLARVLAGVRELALDENVSRKLGVLCVVAGSADVVDAHVALIETSGDALVTSDVSDLTALINAQNKLVELVSC